MPRTERDVVGRRGWLAAGTSLLAIAALAGCGGPDEVAPGAAGERAAALSEQGSARRGRPASVPDDFVVTPHGYFHPDCVLELAEGETVGEDAVVAPGGASRPVRRCGHPRFDRAGNRVEPGEPAAPPPTVSGWVASAWSTSMGPIRSLSAQWRVPSAPANAGAQTVYLFPGLEPASSGAFIFQPVLAWNGFGDRRWTIASWNCCTQGNVWHSAPANVSTGDVVTGSVTGSSCDARGVCASWSIRAAGPRGATTTLSATSATVLDWAFAGALEAYGVDTCDQLPASGGVTFGSIAVRGADGSRPAPSWTPASYAVTPACLSSVGADPGGSSASMTWATR